ncbi:MAG: arginine deiminase-related protein [Pseudomonadota bacterium]
MSESITDVVQDTAAAVLMVRPRRFASNPLTAASNAFQQFEAAPPTEQAQPAALAEFEGVVSALRAAQVEVVVVDDTDTPHTPDSIFPNNWFSTHRGGRVVLYPMQARNRRDERRLDVFEEHLPAAGFEVREIIDLSHHEREGRFLEGTGSVVLDRHHRLAFAARSPRTHEAVVDQFVRALDYHPVIFDATDAAGREIYHTNVLMSVW